ncbi:MAG: proline--tRNA ligase, partial [Planctomycetes bacterium]|nr:proline--tRNA ligase [Planctomycetota bacterium]
MRWSKAFIPTLKDAPTEAESESHRLMLRAGLVRKLAAGSYGFLPLGWRVAQKLAGVVREELDKLGALEVQAPGLQPFELWEQSARAAEFGEALFTLRDRRGAKQALGPAHEEAIVALVKNDLASYRQLPLILYQVQERFRDEARSYGGVIETREFLTADAYSFDADEAGLGRSYAALLAAFRGVFGRCGLKPLLVEAESGSHEFVAVSGAGEDAVIRCSACDYAATPNRAEAGVPPQDESAPEPIQAVKTPDMTTIEQVREFLKVDRKQLVKTMIYAAGTETVAALVRGDHAVNEAKLARRLGVPTLALADEATIERATGAPMGFAGPVGLKLKIVADPAVMRLANMVTGANQADMHLVNVNPGRDFSPDVVADIHTAVDGDPCPKCGKPVATAKGIEVAHLRKLGTQLPVALDATFQSATSHAQPLVMGSYALGLSRLLAAIIEAHHDKNGILWP